MASTWSRHHFSTYRFSLDWLLSLVLTLTSVLSVTGSAVKLTGEVGGNVTFRCPVKQKSPIEFLYLQKDGEFVNGYYALKEKLSNTWENTKFDRNKSAVFMNRLNLSHSGVYSCHIRYTGDLHIDETSIILSVTAKYSRPAVTSPVCREEALQKCHITCRSFGGYPRARMIMRAILTSSNNTSSQMWEDVESDEFHNSSTMLFDIFSTASYNCSNGEMKFSCSVGDVTSDEFSVCVPQEQVNTPIVIAAAICIVVVVVVIVVVLCWRRRTGGSMRLERVHTNEVVEIALYEKNGEKEAA